MSQHRREALGALAPLPVAIAPSIALAAGVRPGDGWGLAAAALVTWVLGVAGQWWARRPDIEPEDTTTD